MSNPAKFKDDMGNDAGSAFANCVATGAAVSKIDWHLIGPADVVAVLIFIAGEVSAGV